jgi:hypothetical protein
MHTAIAVTLLFAGLTSALGAQLNFRRMHATRHPFTIAATLIGAALALWFIVAAHWSFVQAYPL